MCTMIHSIIQTLLYAIYKFKQNRNYVHYRERKGTEIGIEGGINSYIFYIFIS